jgi:hypothetical protein
MDKNLTAVNIKIGSLLNSGDDSERVENPGRSDAATVVQP